MFSPLNTFNSISQLLTKLRGASAMLNPSAASPRPAAALEHARLEAYLRAAGDLPNPSLNALDTRSPSYMDIIAYLVDTGKTPATSIDIQEAFLCLHQRTPGPFELDTMRERVAEFGLAA